MSSAYLRRLSIWCFFVLVMFSLVLFSVWVTRAAIARSPRLTEAQATFVLEIAGLPRRMVDLSEEFFDVFLPFSSRMRINKADMQQPYWERTFPSADDPGFLLFAGVDRDERAAVVKLIRIADGSVIESWRPDWRYIFEHSAPHGAGFGPKSLLPMHPVLLPDGDILFSTGYALVRMGRCSNRPVWILGAEFHHSVEVDDAGHVWVPSVAANGYSWEPWFADRFRDDSIAQVDLNGGLLRNISVAGIFWRNGMLAQLIGGQGLERNDDPVHLNQISVAKTDSNYWKKGDLLLSLRHLSMILLYRPSTDRVVWYKVGPWINQHSVDFYGNHGISVFNNNSIAYLASREAFLPPSHVNEVMLYDFVTDSVEQPFLALLSAVRPATVAQGRAQLLKDGGLFIEETQSGRHLRFAADRLLWSRINDYDTKYIGAVSWSRYLTDSEVVPVLGVIRKKQCDP